MTAKGPVPLGPEPFGLVSDELQSLSDYVKELVVSENPVLTMAASHFFEKVHLQKKIPLINNLLRAITQKMPNFSCYRTTASRQEISPDHSSANGKSGVTFRRHLHRK